MRRLPRLLTAVAFSSSLLPLSPSVRADEMVQADRMLVIAGHPDATKLGLETMRQGGNAIDALVTVSLALGVAEPGNSGLGGKIICLYYDAKTHQTTALAALNAGPQNVPVQEYASIPLDERQRGWRATCTPGLAAALGDAHAKWGKRSWKEDVEPAAKLATDGVVLSDRMAAMMSQYQPQIDATARGIYAPNGKILAAGQTLRNPDLAHTLELIADHGAREFYEGDTATKLIAAEKAGGGYMTLDDLKNYHARFLEPLHGTYRGYSILTSPPPLSGGATMLATLECLEHNPLTDMHARDAQEIDLVARILEQAYPEINVAAADFPDSNAAVSKMLSPENIQATYNRAIDADPRNPAAKKADPAKPAASLAPAGSTPANLAPADLTPHVEGPTLDDTDQASTTHLMIIDRDGDIVCCTQSLGIHFGAAVVAPGTGFLINADLNNFALQTPTSKNYIAPGKWPRSTMTPTIVFKNDKPFLVIGSPAGQRIPVAVLQVMVDVLDFHRPLEDAIRAPRFHVRHATTRGDHVNDVDIEQQSDPSLDATLALKGWLPHRRDDSDFYFGSVNAAEIDPDGRITGVADQRRTSDAGTE